MSKYYLKDGDTVVAKCYLNYKFNPHQKTSDHDISFSFAGFTDGDITHCGLKLEVDRRKGKYYVER